MPSWQTVYIFIEILMSFPNLQIVLIVRIQQCMSPAHIISPLRYANSDRHKRCLIVSKGALVRLTYVASGSVGKCCLTIKRGRHEPNRGPHEAEQEKAK
ncbi:hypothetical protein Tsp_04136, partial [Trichinella spiralis]|uniref:hypothetical protein n=1 Tax=Trichinella spiralis TaxID=6334 RepID=UPI0001EFB75F